MPTIINNPSGSAEDTGSNLLVAVILVVVILAGFVLFFMYGLPAIQNNQNANDTKDTNINVTIPGENNGTTNPPPAY